MAILLLLWAIPICLFFPDDEHFVQWIRQVAGTTDEVARETLVEAFITPQDNLDEDDEWLYFSDIARELLCI